MNKLTEVEIAWVAGIFEGEGHSGKATGGPKCHVVNIGMTDKDVIYKLFDMVGIGHVYTENDNRPHRTHTKEIYRFKIMKQKDIVEFLNIISPHLGDRRLKKAKEVIKAIQQSPDGRTKPIKHGTSSGYHRHRSLGEKACKPCLKAHNEYTKSKKI